MFLEFFDWICNLLLTIYKTMDKFVLFNDFSYFDLSVALLAVSIVLKLLKFIMYIEDEEPHFDYVSSSRAYVNQYDSGSWNNYNNKPLTFGKYIPKHRSMYRVEYIPKHEYVYKGRHGKR